MKAIMNTNLWEAKTDSTLKKFIITTFWHKILQIPNLIAAYVGGSRYYGYEYLDINSDYDIFILTNGAAYTCPYRFLKINNKQLHWTIQHISNFINDTNIENKDYRTGALYAGQVKFNHFDRNLFLYESPKYASVINKLIAYRDQIQLLNFYKYVQLIAQNPMQQYRTCPKAFYHIFAAYLELTGAGSKEWIREIKLNPPAENTKILDFFQTILDWCAAHPIDLIAMERNLYECFYDENNKLIL